VSANTPLKQDSSCMATTASPPPPRGKALEKISYTFLRKKKITKKSQKNQKSQERAKNHKIITKKIIKKIKKSLTKLKYSNH